MKLYIANCIDRHIDPVIRVFTTHQAAIEYAKLFAKVNARGKPIVEEPVEDWLYHASYSEEGDHVYVTEGLLNDDT